MSLEFIDGFDHYTSFSMLQRKWDAGSVAGGGPTFGSGRFTGNAINLNAASGGSFSASSIVKTLTSVATRIIGFAWKGNALGANKVVAVFTDAGTNQVDLRLTAAGQLQVTRNGTVLGTSSFGTPLVVNTWYYIEFKATINSSTGSYTVKVTQGGVTSTWLTGTGANTQNTGNATVNGVQFLCPGDNNSVYSFDDVYMLNTSGTVNNDFLGESRIFTNLPTSDDTAATGTNLTWTPNSGTPHFSRVNESTPDDDTSYVSSATPGQIDTYKYGSITTTGQVVGVAVNMCLRKDDVGTRQINAEYRANSGTNYQGGTNIAPGSSYGISQQIWETDPDTSSAWAVSAVNNGEFGINCVA